MPVKNAEPYLADCLDSIINQTELNWELVAVNDHSTDNSLMVLKAFANVDKRVKIFNNKGQGIIEALRLAYKKSTGNFITRMDADDLMTENKLHLLKQKLLQAGIGYVATGLVKYFSEKQLGNGYKRYEDWLNRLTKNESNFSEIYKECVIPSPCWMLHKQDLEKCEAFKPNDYPEDYDLCFRFYKYKLKVLGVNEIIHYWRDYPNRTSRTDANYLDNRFLNLKLHYFIQLSLQANKTLALWGAGEKGKFIAKYLIKKNVPFSWFTNNIKKINKTIYDIKIENQNNISLNKSQSMVAIANPIEQAQIIKIFENYGLELGSDYFFFC